MNNGLHSVGLKSFGLHSNGLKKFMGQNNTEIKVTNIALCFMFLSLKHYDKCQFMFNSLKMFYCVLVNNDTNNNQIYYIMKFSYVYLIL